MTSAALNKFLKLRKQLTGERAILMERLAQINEALSGSIASVRRSRSATTQPGLTHVSRNSLSLREAIMQVTATRALTKKEILSEVQKLGYRFQATDPMSSLNILLYGRKASFKNVNGLFSPRDSTLDSAALRKGSETQ